MANKKKGNGRGRKRRTEAPDDQVEVRKAQAGPVQKNIKLTSNRQEEHKNTLRGYDAKIKDLQDRRKKAVEQMESEGYNVKALKDLIKLDKLNPVEARDYHEQYAMGLEHAGAQFRMTVHDAAFDDAPAQARHEGIQFAKQGATPECRYKDGTPEHTAFWDGYNREQAKMVPGADKLSEAERDGAVKEGHYAGTA